LNAEPAPENGGEGMREKQKRLRAGWDDKTTSQRSCWHQAEVRRGSKAESGGEVTSQPPKVGQVVDPGAGLMEQRAVLKTELTHLARG
jgi:hypothetical protein